jgi:hypothetical protein
VVDRVEGAAHEADSSLRHEPAVYRRTAPPPGTADSDRGKQRKEDLSSIGQSEWYGREASTCLLRLERCPLGRLR